ncbi:MAG: hypothetical protein JOZ45_23670, partial [Acidobacteriaceae bacterium]|nr:hypothetical protein [Acidobacteriaceae bacterium]
EFVWNCSPRIEGHTLSGLSHAVLANRISYLFDLRGPSAALDTACSSSLVAIHRAASAIRSGECESAIAGGVSVILSPTSYIALSQTRMLSPDGRCKTFDASADGYVRGEGAALLLLRPLRRALAEGDRILGIIRASAENHGGRANSLTAPSASSQAELVVSAFRKAQIDPRTVTYLEAHGTGTSLGDPIEINALKEAFAALYKEGSLPVSSTPTCGIGSLKTNFGHLEAAAGVAGVIKVLLAMRHGALPGLLHHRTTNPMIHLENSPFWLVTQTEPWLTSPGPDGIPVSRRAGVSSFGFGGSNAHIILEEYPVSAADSTEQGPWAFPLSAADPARLVAQCHALGAWLQTHSKVALHNVAFTLQQGRASLQHRVVFIASSNDALIHSLINANDDVVGKQIVTLETADKTVQTIAEQWLHRAAVVWPRSYQAQRLSLPGHPFEQTRYWLSPVSTPANTPVKSDLTIPAVPAITQNAGTQKLRLRLPTPVVNTPSLTDSLASPELLEARSIPEAPASVSLRAEKSETILIQRLRRELASVLYTDEQQIDISRSFIDLGVDSILGIEFARKLSTELGCTVKTADLYDYPNIEALAKYLKALPVAMENHAAPVNANAVPQTAADPTAMQPELLSRLREILARVLYAETSKIPFQKSFADLGVDSILSVELVRDLNREFGTSLSASVLYDYPQLDALAEYLASLLGPGNRPQNPTRPNVSVHPPATSEPPPPNAAPIHRAEDPFPVQKSDLVRSVEPQAAINAIAIIGCSGRFPQALNLHQFWNNLEEAKCSITTFPPDRRNGNFSTGKTWYGGFLDDIDRFDPLFFNISPADAELIDPQQRLFLIEAYRAIEDAGYAPEQFAGRKGGIFAGVTGSDRYAEMLPAERPAQEMMGNAASILAGRVAFFLDFRGPTLTVDTACSSSLVAIHLACRSLLSGETDIALAGGITLYLSEKAWIEMDHAGMLASDGLCKTFDNRADGFVPGEGVGVLVLKR